MKPDLSQKLWAGWCVGMLAAILAAPTLYFAVQVSLIRDFLRAQGLNEIVFAWAALMVLSAGLELFLLFVYDKLFSQLYAKEIMAGPITIIFLLRCVEAILVLASAISKGFDWAPVFFALLAVFEGLVLIVWGSRLVDFSATGGPEWRRLGHWTIARGVCKASVILLPISFLVAIGFFVVSALLFRTASQKIS